MIKTPLSTVIGGAFWTPCCTVMGGQKNLIQLIKSLFANNEQGFAYDPNDLTTLYQNATGTVPVTAAGQPVGLMLDKSKGVGLGGNIIVNGDASQGLDNWSTIASTLQDIDDSFLLTASAQYGSAVNNFAVDPSKTYIVEVEILNNTAGTAVYISVKPTGDNINYAIKQITTLGKHSLIFRPTNSDSARIILQDSATTPKGSVGFKVLFVREIKGNHAYQTVSAMRPILVAAPQRLDYDTADDGLTTTLPAQLTGCTVIRSVPNVGTQILTNQTIPTPYNDNIDNCGLIVINRALTVSETSQITQLFNKAAGV